MGKRGPKIKPNEYSIVNDTVYMLVSDKVVLFDKADLDKVTALHWRLCRNYAFTQVTQNNKQHSIYLHRYILGITDKEIQVDHINGDTFDCRRQNLRTCTAAQNGKNKKTHCKNKTGIPGVIYRKSCPHRPYMVKISVDGHQMCIGHYATLEEATQARRKAEQMYFGDFTRGI